MNSRTRAGRIQLAILPAALALSGPGCLDGKLVLPLSAVETFAGSGPRSGQVSGSKTDTALPSGAERVEESAAIVAKNSSKLTGIVVAPPAIVAKNSSKYRVAAFRQVPSSGGEVVLMTPDGTYLTEGGRRVLVRTDEAGRYDFAGFGIPVGKSVLVAATFPDNRMLIQYAYPVAGDNRVDLDAAGTYASSYFLAQARRAGRSPESYELTRLTGIRDLTLALLDSGALVFEPDHVALGREGEQVSAYQAAFSAASPTLARAWADLLGS